ncbi:hypothetical protein Ddye_030470 [Dipteronia dyeriana]|uniref:Myb-like domain-containing protein n=1 Tax=Dipteronia dyeriana TaxID=168575 RepID=A0AAD9THF8_9ROSI|nr:hypothetical protein Ddye_030470 [Dipteronia dyeriana]
MSNHPPTTTPPPQLSTQPSPSLPSPHYHHHNPQLLPTPTRDYHKGNWTIQETLTLITAKKLNEDYRNTRPTTPISAGKLRWNWIEDYCWSQGCYRSQNQCNDKWDNLLRDYKKVHRYQQSRSSSSSSSSDGPGSYWKMEKHDRKLNNLPSNMSREVYEALNEVVQRRYNNNNNVSYSQHLQQQQLLADQSPTPVTIRQAPPVEVAAPTTEVSGRVDSEETEASSDRRESNLKKRRGGKISTSIKRSASKLAQTLKSCDEMKEKRHQQVMELEQRRLQIEDTSNEVNRQGIAHFLKAVTNLSDAIQSIFSNYNDQT